MQVDFLTLACMRDHLDALLGGRVQHVVLPDNRSVALELYAGKRFYLLASADPQASRILLTPDPPRRGVETETPLLLLLRKWVRWAVLLDVNQPPWERALILDFDGRSGRCQLVVELMGRYSNIILVGPDGTVLDAVKHVGPRMSRTRTTLPGRPYELPPMPQDRRPPTGLGIADWTTRLTQANVEQSVSRWLLGQFLGVSKVVAREIAARAAGDSDALISDVTPRALLESFSELFAPVNDGWWAPHVAVDQSGKVVAFTPYEPRQFDSVEPTRDINEAMWRYFEARGLADPYSGARRALQAKINQVYERLDRRLKRVKGEVVDEKTVLDYRTAGELLLTYQYMVEAGVGDVTLPDYEGEPRTITLDAKLTAVENAQAYFRRYEKARRAAQQIPALVEDLEAQRAYLEQLESDLMLAESRPEIDVVRDAMAAVGWTSKARQRPGPVKGPRRIEEDGLLILIGRNARQNEHVTFERAGPQDLWLHVRGLPGAHVVVKRGRQEVPDHVVQRAAELAAFYSRARGSETQVAVDVTERRFVRRMRGKYPGMVTYRNERTIWVKMPVD